MRNTGWIALGIVLLIALLVFQQSNHSGWGLTGYYGDGSLAGVRPQVNLISGTGVEIAAADNPANNRVNYTITASGGVGTDLNVPSPNATANVLERDVIGNKEDASVNIVGTTKSLMAYTKGNIGLSTDIKTKTDSLPATPAAEPSVRTLLDGVYVDSANGVLGTAWPIGTPENPSSNLTDALSIAVARNLTRIYLRGSYSLPSDLASAYDFRGWGGGFNELSFNGKFVAGSSCHDLSIYGSASGLNDELFAYRCTLAGIDDAALNITAWDSALKGGGGLNVKNMTAYRLASADVISGAYSPSIFLEGVTGELELVGMVGGSITIVGSGVHLYVDSDCTSGNVYVYGDVTIGDYSQGAVVFDHTNRPRPETAVNIAAIAAGETDVLNLATAEMHYTIDTLVLKSADPGADTVNVRLYQLVNGVLTNTKLFAITTSNYTTYYDLMSLFGVPHLAGDKIQITIQATGGGPYAVTGSYTYRSS